ncbi:hypothetical protein C8R45DRAFT_1047835 [Mycena sanguinolenta]|nr:hypothetical protein C8R45DRAFT_1047835 [Mycena sanguinolenta]
MTEYDSSPEAYHQFQRTRSAFPTGRTTPRTVRRSSGPSHRTSRRRAQSHSPTRTIAAPSRPSRSHHRSPTRRMLRAPQYTVQYGTQYPNYSVQYANPAPVQYVQPQPGGYTVVYPSDRKIQIVYPPAAHPTQEHHSGGLLRRIFGSQSGKHERSRSLSHSRR